LSSTTQTGQSIVNRTPVYYGWVIWLVAVVGLSASMPGQTANVSLFIDRWIADFGLTDRSTISALYGIGTFFASLTMVFIGNRLDRFGARTVGVAVALIFAAALVYMSFVNGLVMLAIGFFLIRMLGQGGAVSD
jgi:MFS family permease